LTKEGGIEEYSHDQSDKFNCKSGYTSSLHTGNSIRITCKDGKWTTDAQCEEVKVVEEPESATPDAAPEKNTVNEQKKKSCPHKYTQSMHQGDSSEVECKQWCDDEGESCKCYSIDTNNTCRLYKDLAVKEQKKKSCDEHNKKAVENVSEVVQNPQNQQLAP
jgi:hypothetical protein